jgi:hypothetical protein
MITSMRKLALVGLILPLAGCKLALIVTSGGDVQSASATRDCDSGHICEFTITSDDFDETFTAIPRAGYVFKQWATGPGFVCGGSTNPVCVVSNVGMGAFNGVMDTIASDHINHAMPLFDFVGTDTDGDLVLDHLDEDDDNDGVYDVDDLYPFDPTLTCPAAYALRTPSQVLASLRNATSAQNWDDVACHYRPNAVVLDDQGILVGHSDIITAAQSLSDLFNGVSAYIVQEGVFGNTARVLYSLDGGWVEIEDGVNSYVIENGVITAQTAHGTITFNGPPPDQN